MTEPTEADIKRIKAEFSNRSVHRVDLTCDSDESIVFIMTGPSVHEYDKFVEDVERAKGMKAGAEREKALRAAIQNNALAQIRWPERANVVALFEKYPILSVGLAEQLHNTAGASFEVRSKNL